MIKGDRFLVVTEKYPFPPDSGSKQRSWLLLKALSEIGAVDLLVLQPQPEGLSAAAPLPGVSVSWCAKLAPRSLPARLRQLRDWVFPFRHSPPARALVAQMMQRRAYAAVIFRYMNAFALAGQAGGGSAMIVDVDDLDTQKLESEGRSPGVSWGRRLSVFFRLWRMRRPFARLLDSADLLVFSAAEDATRLSGRRVRVLPNIPFDMAVRPAPAATGSSDGAPTIKFLGRLSWEVNLRGLEGFIAHAWPAIRQTVPEAVLEIGGSGLGAEHRARWSAIPGVRPVGFVDDIAAFYRTATITICPLFEGGGTKIKLLESLWHQRAVVAARHSVRGQEEVVADGEGVFACDGWPEMAARCTQLLIDAPLRHRTEATGFARLARNVSWEAYRERVKGIVAVARRDGKGVA